MLRTRTTGTRSESRIQGLGTWYNGNIIEIVPEPAPALILIIFGGLLMVRREYRRAFDRSV